MHNRNLSTKNYVSPVSISSENQTIKNFQKNMLLQQYNWVKDSKINKEP